jgi:hypothetical protein
MPAPKFIEIDGKRFVWRELLRRRRLRATAKITCRTTAVDRSDLRPSRTAVTSQAPLLMKNLSSLA